MTATASWMTHDFLEGGETVVELVLCWASRSVLAALSSTRRGGRFLCALCNGACGVLAGVRPFLLTTGPSLVCTTTQPH